MSLMQRSRFPGMNASPETRENGDSDSRTESQNSIDKERLDRLEQIVGRLTGRIEVLELENAVLRSRLQASGMLRPETLPAQMHQHKPCCVSEASLTCLLACSGLRMVIGRFAGWDSVLFRADVERMLAEVQRMVNAGQQEEAFVKAIEYQADTASRVDFLGRALGCVTEEEAFVKAIEYQAATASRVDFLGGVCRLVDEKHAELEDWLEDLGGTCPLSMQVKMDVMLALARQLEAKGIETGIPETKLRWIQELWFALEPLDPSIELTVLTQCTELAILLKRAAEDPDCTIGAGLKKVIRSLEVCMHIWD